MNFQHHFISPHGSPFRILSNTIAASYLLIKILIKPGWSPYFTDYVHWGSRRKHVDTIDINNDLSEWTSCTKDSRTAWHTSLHRVWFQFVDLKSGARAAIVLVLLLYSCSDGMRESSRHNPSLPLLPVSMTGRCSVNTESLCRSLVSVSVNQLLFLSLGQSLWGDVHSLSLALVCTQTPSSKR